MILLIRIRSIGRYFQDERLKVYETGPLNSFQSKTASEPVNSDIVKDQGSLQRPT